VGFGEHIVTTAIQETLMKVLADKGKCVGAGTCAVVAPDIFDQDDADGIVVVLDEHPGQDRRAAVEEAVDFCPAQALMLAEKD
jgi:ferredoxin